MWLKALIFAVFCVIAVASVSLRQPVNYHDCGSATGKIKIVEVEPCPTQPCVLKKGSSVTVHISFTPSENATAVKTSVHGEIAGVAIPFPLNPDGCKDCGLACPLAAGEDYVYSKSIDVLHSYPAIKLVIKWELQDQNGQDLVCMEIPAQIS